MRMLWACSHVMLRLTEIPLFLNAGLEVIPIEVTPQVSTYAEGSRYDDPQDPINQIWKKNLTISIETANILRRSKLWERNGKISQEEIDIFNEYLDIIYIPTRYELALEVASWFKGIVIFRYFGDIPAGRKGLSLIQKTPSHIRNRIYFVPIFKSLLDKPFTKFFNHIHVLHNYLDNKIVTSHWKKQESNKEALIVLGGLQLIESQVVIRSLFSLAKQIPIKLLGKNIENRIPRDIRSKFNIMSNLDRNRFFEEFFNSQFLIYPHSNPFHSHNVPIEAIFGGMPIVFRTSTPTFIENTHSQKILKEPTIIGACKSRSQLIKFSTNLFDNFNLQSELVKDQSYLITPYKLESVETELSALISDIKSNISASRSSSKKIFDIFPLAAISSSDYFFNAKEVVNDNFTGNITNFIHDDTFNSVKLITFENRKFPALKILNCETYRHFLFGEIINSDPVFFSNGVDHQFSFDIYGNGFGKAHLHCTVLSKNREIAVYKRYIYFNSHESLHHHVSFNIRHDEPFQIAGYIKKSGSVDYYIGQIHHRCILKNAQLELRNFQRIGLPSNILEHIYSDELLNCRIHLNLRTMKNIIKSCIKKMMGGVGSLIDTRQGVFKAEFLPCIETSYLNFIIKKDNNVKSIVHIAIYFKNTTNPTHFKLNFLTNETKHTIKFREIRELETIMVYAKSKSLDELVITL